MIDLAYLRNKLTSFMGNDAGPCIERAIVEAGVGKKGIYSREELDKILDSLVAQGGNQRFVARIIKTNLILDQIRKDCR